MSNDQLEAVRILLGNIGTADITGVVVIGSDDGGSEIAVTAVFAFVNRCVEVNDRDAGLVGSLEG